jgi:hypothetical protein
VRSSGKGRSVSFNFVPLNNYRYHERKSV